MKIKGHFTVVLTDGRQQYHQNGAWVVRRGKQEIAWSVDHAEFVPEADGLRDRLQGVAPGDMLEAASASGKTGVCGEVIARAGNYLVINGTAWGPSHSAYGPKGRVAFATHTFTVVSRHGETWYAGFIAALVGSSANHALIRDIEGELSPSEAEVEAKIAAEAWECSPKHAPMWA